jgi:hypothetical protein
LVRCTSTVKPTLIPDFCRMKKLSTQLIFGILGIAGTLGISTFQAAIAQTPSRDANVYRNTQGGDRSSDMGTMFDFFHRAVLGSPRSSSEFGQEQQNSIGSEASDFRQRREELLRQQQQGSTMTRPQASPTPIATPSRNN